MPMFAFDGAGPFDLNAAKAHGAIAVTVYIVGTPGGMPHADKARVDAARALGLGVLPNWERQADYFGFCANADAQSAGVEAVAACRALGFPDDGSVACAFSFDFDIPSNRFPEMAAKVKALTAGLAGCYRLMLYAQQALIDWLTGHGYLTGGHWLMMSTFNQPYNPRSSNVCMVQEHDIDGNWLTSPVAGTDINTVTDPHALGAWWPAGSPFGGADDMTPEEHNWLRYLFLSHDVGGLRTQSPQGEFGLALRQLRDNFGHLATDADVAALPHPPIAAEIAKAVVAALPTVNLTPQQIQAVVDGIAAKLPATAGMVVTSTIAPLP